MIGFLKGKVMSIKPTRLILNVNGVGYLVYITVNTFEKISESEETSLFIYTAVKEDSITLYGFYSESEKEMFELLISVNGIGPKSAQTILSGITVEDLKYAIGSGNILKITSAPGIGRKTAERLLVELKGKVESISMGESESDSGRIKTEAIAALTTLGYNLKTAEKTVRDILTSSNSISLEELIKRSLGELNR
jgi:Holliday junction DNA helicase RuvA